MPGIQISGRNRNNTNKIEQVKTQNKVIAVQQTRSTRSTRYQPRPASGKLDQSTQNQIQPTASNIEQAVRVKKVKHVVKPRTSNDPASKIMLGMGNTVQDYGGIVQDGYVDKSILNQSITKAIEGDLAGAGKLIQENPYRFAGNLILEAGTALIPLGAVLKIAKVAKVTNKVSTVLKNAKDKIKPTMTVYKIVEPSQGKTFWSGNEPQTYYFNKVLYGNYKEGMPQLRSIDIPKSTPNVDTVVRTSGVYNQDTGTFIPRSLLQRGIKESDNFNPTPVRDTKFPGKAPLEDYISVPKEPGLAREFALVDKQKGKKTQIGKEVYEYSRDWKNEYPLKTDLQAKEKVVATLGEKESLIQRITHPWYSDDKFANALSKTNMEYPDKYISYFSPWGVKMGRGGADFTHQAKPQNIVFHKAYQIKNKGKKIKQSIATGLITGGTLSFTNKMNAMDEGIEGQKMYETKRISAIAEEWKKIETIPGFHYT
tara:strand:+ start:1978 stop:3423 length:1446 start_codon:yes stop_codon:yes gene_type:complete